MSAGFPGPSRSLNRLLSRGEALSVHFDLGLRHYDAGEMVGLRRHLAAVGMLPEGGRRCLQWNALGWRLKWLEDDPDGALEQARQVTKHFPEDPHAPLELADILRELGRHDEVLEVLLNTCRLRPNESDLWYDAGIAAEKMTNWEVRRQSFQRVWELEAHGEPAWRLWLPEERFLEVAEAVLEDLPEKVRAALGNVVVLVEDYPDAWILESHVGDPRLLGLFDGADRAAERGVDFVATGPARVYLFRWNIERICSSDLEVEEQIQITILHEIGHYLGLDEEDLMARGLS